MKKITLEGVEHMAHEYDHSSWSVCDLCNHEEVKVWDLRGETIPECFEEEYIMNGEGGKVKCHGSETTYKAFLDWAEREEVEVECCEKDSNYKVYLEWR